MLQAEIIAPATRRMLCPTPAGRAAGRHPFTVLSYQIAGELHVEQNGPLELRAGDFYVIPAGHAHRVTRTVDAELWSVQLPTAHLDPERFAPVLAPIESMARGALPRVSVPANRRDLVASLFSELANARTGAPLRIESLMALLLGELAEHAASTSALAPRHTGDLAARAVSLIASQALGPLSLDALAKKLGRNRSHVAEVVRRATGQTVGELVAEIRLGEARRRLEQTDELVEIIGERVGYPDPTHFARMFKRRYGQSPRAWRRAHP
ncbi:helix-turn-helix domain-containing protein [Pendulispora albinea]|uniref:AraC family transcriptional regulator n=1 Tax=Pendulispora albinea TaxID=2741071 RepID=A0ABZ2LUA4_9BACT